MVMGFLSDDFTVSGITRVGVLDPASTTIAPVWRHQVAVPVRPDLAQALLARGGALQAIVSLLLDN